MTTPPAPLLAFLPSMMTMSYPCPSVCAVLDSGVGIGFYSFFTTIAGSFMTYAVGLILDDYTSDAAIKVRLSLAVSAPAETCLTR